MDHELVLDFGKIQDTDNIYSTITPDDFYFENSDVDKIIKALSQSNINQAIKQSKKKDQLAGAFK